LPCRWASGSVGGGWRERGAVADFGDGAVAERDYPVGDGTIPEVGYRAPLAPPTTDAP
jgi:hypothetical protein